MFTTLQNLILASASPRRRGFLERLGLEFTIYPAQIDETCRPQELPLAYVERLAEEKARLVSARFPEHWIISADTSVSLEGRHLGKPASKAEAVSILLELSDKVHHVQTGYCLACLNKSVTIIRSCITEVQFQVVSEKLAWAYVNTNEPLDKAGAYGIQGLGTILVQAINGSYSNVVGLPMAEMTALLLEYQIIAPRSDT